MTGLLAQYGLLLVALVIFAGEVGLPTLIPGEVALLFAGSQFIHSPLALVGALLLFGAVDIVATTTIHSVSRTGGNRLLRCLVRHCRRDGTPPEDVIACWRKRLGGHDAVVVLVTRMIPMFRLYASISTGLIRIRFRDFVAGAAPAAWLWAATPLTLGYILRHRIGAMTAQYPAMMHYVILASVGIFGGLAIIGWLRHAGSRAAASRRIRVLLTLAAVSGALARLLSVALAHHTVAGHNLAVPYLPALATWVSIIGLVGLALLWIAAHDLRIICTRNRKPGFGMPSAVAWASLMVLLGAAAFPTGFQALAL